MKPDRRTFVFICLLAISGCTTGAIRHGPGSSVIEPTDTTTATSQVGSPMSPQAADLGPTPANEQVYFTISLHLPGKADMDAYIAGLSVPGSASYGRYLDAAQFGARFGLPDLELHRVVAWLQDAGLSTEPMPQRTSVAVRGTAGEVNRLLGITLADRRRADGARYHVALGTPRVPIDVQPDVATVLGLNTEPVQRPAFGGMYMSGVPSPGLTSSTVSRAYEIDALHAAGFNGDGLSVAILSFDTFTPGDVTTFDQRVGLSAGPTVQRVSLPGGPQAPGDGTGEVALDIMTIRSIAPHAQIINYEGPNTINGNVAIVSRIVADGKAQVISDSWGACENRSDPDSMAAEEQELAAAFARGISIFVASGDDGAYDCRSANIWDDPFKRDINPSVDWPSASASVIAVGGTFLTTRDDGTYVDEAGWEDPLSGAGGGGGLSRTVQRPSWQQGNGVDNSKSDGMRQVPDVAGPADPTSGFFVIYTDPDQDTQVAGEVGGTSAAAPFWAASMLLTEQVAHNEGVAALGPLGPVLYAVAAQHPEVFHDVLRGGNLLFDAGPGWDYSTGLGTPRVAPLARAIVDYVKVGGGQN